MPERWRARLAHAFWRPHAFAQELATLSRPHDGQSLPLPPEELTPDGVAQEPAGARHLLYRGTQAGRKS